MPIRHTLMVLLLAACTALAACATPASGRVYPRHEARMAWNVEKGRIVAIEEVSIEGRRSALGRIGGGFVGYEVGRSVGQGSGSRIAGAVGAVAGAMAGEAVEERITREPAFQISVDLDNGRSIAVVQARDQVFQVGERVRVYTRRDGAARVARD